MQLIAGENEAWARQHDPKEIEGDGLDGAGSALDQHRTGAAVEHEAVEGELGGAESLEEVGDHLELPDAGAKVFAGLGRGGHGQEVAEEGLQALDACVEIRLHALPTGRSWLHSRRALRFVKILDERPGVVQDQDVTDRANAVLHIDAHEYAARELYLHRDDATREWYMATGEEMDALAAMLDADVDDAYSLWCANTVPRLVDVVDVVNSFPITADTDLDTLQAEAGAADDMITYMAIEFLSDDIADIVRVNAEIAAENAA